MILRRALLIAILGVTGLALQTSVLGSLSLVGTKPEFLLLIALAFALTDGPAVGATAGFAFGLLTDAVLELPGGVSALTFTLVGYAVGALRARMQAPSAWVPTALISTATVVAVAFYGGFSLLLGVGISPERLVRHALLAGAYNALLTPFLFPLIRGLASFTRPRTTEVMR